MSLYQKSLFYIMLAFPVFSMPSMQSFQLARVKYPDEQSIQIERQQSDARAFKKYAVTVTVVVSVVVGLYLLYQIREAAAKHERESAKNTNAIEAILQEFKDLKEKYNLVVKDPSLPATPARSVAPASPEGWMSSAANSAKSFGLGTAKFFADSAFLLASGTVLNGAYNYACKKVAQTYVDETVLWYAHEKTQLPLLFNDLKTYSIDYDLFATLLSLELFNQEAQMHFKAFVKDLLGSAQNYMHNDVFNDPAYFNYLLEEMKKKYIKKGQEMEKLSDHVVSAVAKQHRAIAQEHAIALFSHDMNRRGDIAKMCDLFAHEMEKLTSFIALRGGLYQQARVFDMVDSSNKFLAHMEILINSTPEELQAYSKADVGMFTSTFEYEKLFSEQINFLHRYCRLAN